MFRDSRHSRRCERVCALSVAAWPSPYGHLHYNGPGPLFPTLRLDDDRLPLKEQVWGINIGGEQVAYARSFLERQRIDNTTIGDVPVLVAWFSEHETLSVFVRPTDIEVQEVDVYGNTPDGRLERLPQYAHVFWMVWSHWYPGTDVRI